MSLSLGLVLAVFFASGFAALLYQVVWQRLLAIFSGADVYSATVIVAAYMAGLGLGSLAGGWVADRVSRRASALLFAGSEVAVGVFGAWSATLYYDIVYQQLGPRNLGPAAIGLVLFISLLWPTLFMGASLPLLARAMTERVDRAAFTVGALYGCNTLGAAVGAVVATWVLLPRVGLAGSVEFGAALNLGCAAAAIPLARRLSDAPPAPVAAAPSPAVPAVTLWPWMLAYAVSGFIALSYEIVWFRLLGVIVKSSAFTFGTLLALYLTGIGLGAVVGSRLAARSTSSPARLFFGLQAAAGACASLALLVFVALAEDVVPLADYLGQYEPLSVRASVQAMRELRMPADFVWLYLVCPSLLVLPATLLMGASFPAIQRVVQHDAKAVGRRVAALVVANIGGSIAGAVLTGAWLLTALGSAGTLKLLAALSGVFLILALRDRGWRVRAAAAATTLAVVLALPDSTRLWARLHGATPETIVQAEDSTGVSVIRAGRPGASSPRVVFVNGMGQSVLPYGDIHTALGVLPVLVHPAPADVAIIGLGSGDTAYAASGRPEVERITCIEIIGPQLMTLRALARRDLYGGLHGLLGERRIEHVVGDGRAYLLRSPARFDVIEADALRPTSAYSGNLYSDAYFALVKRRLKPGGLATTWAPTQRVYDGFVKVFPYVVSLPGLLIGSSDPIAIDRAQMLQRASDPRIREHFARASIDIAQLVASYVPESPVRYDPTTNRAALVDLNTDLFPKDEFDLAPP